MKDKILKIISLGAGLQSSAMLLMSLYEELEPVDAIIFADTGWETISVYKNLEFLIEESKKFNIPFYIVNNGNIYQDSLNSLSGKHGNFISMPYFVKNEKNKISKLRRQCTYEYKIYPIRKKIKELLIYKNLKKAELWLGITIDEYLRMKKSNVKYLVHKWPLIEIKMSRRDCIKWFNKKNLSIPKKSSCIGCPYHDDLFWRDMKNNDSENFKIAIEFDKKIRKFPRIDGDVFIHRKAKPLCEIDFRNDIERGQQQFGFLNDCDGLCGV